MNPIKKLKNRRGTTLIEVLLVVALMLILLGIAMPDLISESRAIKFAGMNDNARAVAVAVQSKLYGLKNRGTAVGSDYWTLNEKAAKEIDADISIGGVDKTVKYIANFGENGKSGGKYLSGAMTDSELLKKGKIVVVYDPETADVIATYYSEKPFDVETLFPVASEPYLEKNVIGSYLGYGASLPENKIGMPGFTIAWRYDDELYIELKMSGNPDISLLTKRLGLEIFAEIPDPEEVTKKADVLIYAEGMFASDYPTADAGQIKAETTLFNLDVIQKNGGYLRFALDSMIMGNAYYGNLRSYLRHQTNPEIVSAATGLLYPRESIADWFNKTVNPYLEFGKNEGLTSESVYNFVTGGNKPITEIIGVDKPVRLRVELHVLSDTSSGAKGSESAFLYAADDENVIPMKRRSQNITPYFYAYSQLDNTVTLSSMRDLNNLHYVFQSDNNISRAVLSSDIDEQQFYDKLIAVRHELRKKDKSSAVAEWGYGSTWATGSIEASYCDKETFTLSGKNPDGGSYAISCFRLGQSPDPGGLFKYARNCTFEDLDIVNPLVQKNGSSRAFMLQEKTEDPMYVTGINMNWGDTVSGALVGVAVNCTFRNVRAYIDPKRALLVENNDDGTSKGRQGVTDYRVTGVVVGGLVGIAIGNEGKPTMFENCSASLLVEPEKLRSPAECVYAGGLVGLAMGQVEIKNSYAASQLSGYYAGGLVGGTGSGSWKYNLNSVDRGGSAYGSLSIFDSFAAGSMMYNIRVGGGLIGHAANVGTVSGCYSAVNWKILPPVAYGTYKGDKKNFYIYQKELDFPVTANVLARFKVKGDVFSKQGADCGGIPCSETTLEAKLIKKGDPQSKWAKANTTRTWAWTEYAQFDPYADLSSYPFPMPAGNTDFYGVWVRLYDEGESITEAPPAFCPEFEGFYVAYYYIDFNSAVFRFVDGGAVISLTRKIELTEDNEIAIKFKYDGDKMVKLQTDGVTLEGGNEVYWAHDVIMQDKDLFGQGADGATKISAKDGKIEFVSAAYYDPDYNAVKGSEFRLPDGFGKDDNFTGDNIPLMWDFCGYYFVNLIDPSSPKRYYISFKTKDGRTAQPGERFIGDTHQYGTPYQDGETMIIPSTPRDFTTIVVNETEFKNALKYGTISLSATNVTIEWDTEDGHFYVKDGVSA